MKYFKCILLLFPCRRTNTNRRDTHTHTHKKAPNTKQLLQIKYNSTNKRLQPSIKSHTVQVVIDPISHNASVLPQEILLHTTGEHLINKCRINENKLW